MAVAYPSYDPHPIGSLMTETVTKTVLWESSDKPVNNVVTKYHSWIKHHKGATYFCYITAGNRPKIVKIDQSGTTEVFIEPPDYTVLDDRHNGFSVGIDRNGYIHIMGDMHAHSEWSDSGPNVSRYFHSHLMYWKSNLPESITGGFTFMGWEDPPIIPDGHNWTYQMFINDMTGKLYLRARNATYTDSPFLEGNMALMVYAYDESTGWGSLGELNPTHLGKVANHKSVFWENNGEYWQDQRAGYPDTATYQGYYNGWVIDRANVMHFFFSINNVTMNRNCTDVVYWKSDDGGLTFKKADGTVINAPVRAEAGANQGDIIHTGRLLSQCFVGVSWDGMPVVSYSKYVNDSQDAAAVAESTPRVHKWTGAAWQASTMPFTSYADPILQGSDLILTYIRGGVSAGSGKIYRTRRFGEAGYEYLPGGNIEAFDEIHFSKYNELFCIINTGATQQVVKLKFSSPELLPYVESKQINKRMML